jgi:ADP-heptose:LPS heptosyltransferase
VYINYNQVALAMGASILPYQEVSDFFIRHNHLENSRTDGAQAKIAIAPFCSELGKEREFSPEHWTKILKRKFEGQAPELTILGGPNDHSRASQLERHLKEAFPGFIIHNRAGKTTLQESAMLIKSADEFLTIDSGLNHIARLTGGVRITSYWGPTDPATRLAPFPQVSESVVYSKLFCSPCVHTVASPPCKGNNICMKQYVKEDLNQYSSGGWLIISNSATPKNI